MRCFNPDEDKISFCNAPLRLNTLNSMMKSMSSRAGIQPHLTNHCLRATPVTVLSDSNCETRHIRSVTGHKSDQSIESYNDLLSLEQHRVMLNVLSTFLHSSEASRQSSSSARSVDKENTTATKSANESTTAIQETPVSVLVQHNQLSVNSNSMASFANGRDQRQRFPPQFNFHNCTNVQIHNNFGPGSCIFLSTSLGCLFNCLAM